MKRHLATASLALVLFLGSPCRGAGTFAIDVAAGLPHLISLELSYWGLGPFVFGIGFGSLPVNSILKKNIPMDSQVLSNGYNLIPSANYSFLAISAFARWFPFNQNKGSGTFLELNVARWRFGSNVYGDLQDPVTGTVIGGALDGSIDFQQPLATAAIGYRGFLTSNLFMHAAIGATYLFTPTYSTFVGGSLTSVLPLADQTMVDSFDAATTDINNQVDQGVASLRATTKVIPALWFSIGWLI